MNEFIKIGKKSDFPENQTKGIEVNGSSVCIANFSGHLTAFDNTCTHAESQLSDCDIEDGQVACPLHGARFDVKTGQAMSLPAVRPVKMHEVKIEGDSIFVKLNR